MIVIGLHGKARVGKDVAAQYLAERFGMVPVAFARPLKLAGRAMLNLVNAALHGDLKEAPLDRYGFSPRQLFQHMGDCIRALNPDAFLYMAEDYLAVIKEEHRRMAMPLFGVTLTDIRAENEAAWVRARGGQVLHITRDEAKPVNAHHSENGIAMGAGDIRLPNNGTLDEFYKRLECAVLDRVVDPGVVV